MLGTFRRRRLPHSDVPGATYFVTTCLEGSIPALGLQDLDEYQHRLESEARPSKITPADWELQKHKRIFRRWDEWLDGRPAVRHLEKAELASSVQRSVYHFAKTRYHVVAYVVMPSHLHWVFRPTAAWCEEVARIEAQRPTPRMPREIIMHGLKSFTAHECNALLGKSGAFWQAESFDHWVRHDDELQRIIDYVEQNHVLGILRWSLRRKQAAEPARPSPGRSR